MAKRSRAARIRLMARNLVEAKRPKSTGKGVAAPISIEVRYNKGLQELVQRLEQDTREKIMPLVVTTQSELIMDDSLTDLEGIIDGLQEQYASLDEIYRQYADVMVGAVNVYHQTAFIADVKQAVGVDIRGMAMDEGIDGVLRVATRRNVKLIKSIPEQFFNEIEQIIMQGFQTGEDPANINEKLVERFGITERRARFIARDQVGKLTASLSKARQQNIGVDGYIWDDSGDSNVRKSHAKKNGKRIDWNKPPSDTGHAGEDFNCRCVARPDFSKLLNT